VRAVGPPVFFFRAQELTHANTHLAYLGRCFRLKRSENNQFVVITDVDMFEDVLTYDADFGNPVTPNMSVNKCVGANVTSRCPRH
jgi:hypothetical protein